MKHEYKFQDGEIVEFNQFPISGVGRIKGVANEGVAVLGATYIVEVISSTVTLPNSDYPYKTIAVFESNIIKTDARTVFPDLK